MTWSSGAPDLGWLDDPDAQWRMLIDVRYQGPFGRIMDWLWCIDPDAGEPWREVRPGTVRNWLAVQAEQLDRLWRRWYARRRRMPPDRWRRKVERPG